MSNLESLAKKIGVRPLARLKRGSVVDHMLRFGTVGVIGLIINVSIVVSLAPRLGAIAAQAVAFPAAASATWWLNRRHTFGASSRTWHAEWLRYVSANMIGWMANNGVFLFLIFEFAGIHRNPAIAVAAGSLAGMIFNFAISRWIVFR